MQIERFIHETKREFAKLIVIFETIYPVPKQISTYPTSLLGFLHESCFNQLHPNAIKLRRPVEDPPVCSRSRVPLKPFQREPYSSYFSQKPKQFFSPEIAFFLSTSFQPKLLSAIKLWYNTGNRVPTFEKPISECRYLERRLNTLHILSRWTHTCLLPRLFLFEKLRVSNIGRSQPNYLNLLR